MKQFSISFKLIVFASLAIIFTGCGTSSISLNVMRPADINVSQDIQRLGLVNRYQPEKGGDKFLNILEGFLSGEGIGQDRRGAQSSLQGLANVLVNSPRFQTSWAPDNLGGSGTGVFPPPLTKKEVQALCGTMKVDALVTIEAFDSDSRINYNTYKTKETRNKQTVEVVKHRAIATLNVTVGWRMYDGRSGTLIDEYRMNQSINFQGRGNNPTEARNNLPQKEFILRDMGAKTGDRYAKRISPAPIRVRRLWFTKAKGNQDMKVARDLMRAGNWSRARDYYTQALQDPNRKVKGRAAYNLAIVAEVYGELADAINWTDEAIEYGENKAISYRRILENRIVDEQRLDEQLGK